MIAIIISINSSFRLADSHCTLMCLGVSALSDVSAHMQLHMLPCALATASPPTGRDFARQGLKSERGVQATGTDHLAWRNKDQSPCKSQSVKPAP